MYVNKDYDKTVEGYFDPSIEVEVTLDGTVKHKTMYSHLCDDCTPEAIEAGFIAAKDELTCRIEQYAKAVGLPKGIYFIESIYSLHDPYGDEYLDSDTDWEMYWNGTNFGFVEGFLK